MCGITGLALDSQQRPCRELLTRMCAALQHRGPDGAGGFIDAGIGLAMRRLAVIDVAGGWQPVFNEDKSIAAVFNGEIYNFRQLRQRLLDRGHQLRTHSDSETIVHLYEDEGLDFVQRLDGMFAIAIWDANQRRLMLVRDRLGVKPLYYAHTADGLAFGSEIKSLLQIPKLPRQLNHTALHQLFTWGHMLPPETAFESVRELPPGCWMTYQQGQPEIQPYWELDYTDKTNWPPNTSSAGDTYETGVSEAADMDRLEQTVRAAVERRLISEVPLGAFLSGGIDSGIVVAMMSQLLGEPVKTFSIGFDDRDFSELPAARRVADHCGTEHHELVIQPNVSELLEDLVRHHDAPFYDSSAVPTYYVSQFARQHVTVALSGDGGDETFAGYNIYVANRVAEQLGFVPPAVFRATNWLAQCLPESSKYINKGRVAREFLRAAPLDPLRRYTRWATKVKREIRDQLYAAAELQALQQTPDESWIADTFALPQRCTELNRLLYLGTKTELPADMLRKVDRMSMAHSLEVRSPLLDHHVMEFAARLPDAAKLRGRTTKFALRQLAAKLLPSDVLQLPKRGFSIPLDRWLRTDLRDQVRQVLLDPATLSRGLFAAPFVEQLIQQHQSGRISRGRELWTLLTTEIFLRNYIDRFDYYVQPSAPLQLAAAPGNDAAPEQII